MMNLESFQRNKTVILLFQTLTKKRRCQEMGRPMESPLYYRKIAKYFIITHNVCILIIYAKRHLKDCINMCEHIAHCTQMIVLKNALSMQNMRL